jgi:hypothetical protein
MIREFPPDWVPEWPPEPGRFGRLIDALFDRCPFWDQIVLLAVFAFYLCALCAAVIHLA